MKNTILCLAALLITFLMTSCNKDRLEETIVDDGSKAVLKLRASCNVDNRSDIEHDEQDSSILNVTWNCSDKVYVFGAKEGFLGTLLLDDDCEGKEIGQFTGTIDRFETQVLHFFYLGKASRDFNKNEKEFSIDFSNQDGLLDGIEESLHVAYGSTETSVHFENVLSVAIVFQNAMAIGYFDLNGFDGPNVKLYGKNVCKSMKIKINNDGSISTSGEDIASLDSPIWLGPPSLAGKYVAIVPGDEVSFHFEGTTTSFDFPDNEIVKNMFYSYNGEPLPTIEIPNGALKGVFSVSPTKHVRFSKGNLQYLGSEPQPYWQFAEQQYNSLKLTSGQNSYALNVDRDLFGWIFSGLMDDNYPWNIVANGPSYGPSGQHETLEGFWDWGYNAIANGDVPNMNWRTLSGGPDGEWKYLINDRRISIINQNGVLENQVSFGFGSILIDGVNIEGIFLLPDNFILPAGISFENAPQSNNVFNIDQWGALENAGVVFLPKAGRRNKTDVTIDGGYYWSKTGCKKIAYAYHLSFSETLNACDSSKIFQGNSVRLVLDVD